MLQTDRGVIQGVRAVTSKAFKVVEKWSSCMRKLN